MAFFPYLKTHKPDSGMPHKPPEEERPGNPIIDPPEGVQELEDTTHIGNA
jgi:hypothetical protein